MSSAATATLRSPSMSDRRPGDPFGLRVSVFSIDGSLQELDFPPDATGENVMSRVLGPLFYTDIFTLTHNEMVVARGARLSNVGIASGAVLRIHRGHDMAHTIRRGRVSANEAVQAALNESLRRTGHARTATAAASASAMASAFASASASARNVQNRRQTASATTARPGRTQTTANADTRQSASYADVRAALREVLVAKGFSEGTVGRAADIAAAVAVAERSSEPSTAASRSLIGPAWTNVRHAQATANMEMLEQLRPGDPVSENADEALRRIVSAMNNVGQQFWYQESSRPAVFIDGVEASLDVAQGRRLATDWGALAAAFTSATALLTTRIEEVAVQQAASRTRSAGAQAETTESPRGDASTRASGSGQQRRAPAAHIPGMPTLEQLGPSRPPNAAAGFPSILDFLRQMGMHRDRDSMQDIFPVQVAYIMLDNLLQDDLYRLAQGDTSMLERTRRPLQTLTSRRLGLGRNPSVMRVVEATEQRLGDVPEVEAAYVDRIPLTQELYRSNRRAGTSVRSLTPIIRTRAVEVAKLLYDPEVDDVTFGLRYLAWIDGTVGQLATEGSELFAGNLDGLLSVLGAYGNARSIEIFGEDSSTLAVMVSNMVKPHVAASMARWAALPAAERRRASGPSGEGSGGGGQTGRTSSGAGGGGGGSGGDRSTAPSGRGSEGASNGGNYSGSGGDDGDRRRSNGGGSLEKCDDADTNSSIDDMEMDAVADDLMAEMDDGDSALDDIDMDDIVAELAAEEAEEATAQNAPSDRNGLASASPSLNQTTRAAAFSSSRAAPQVGSGKVGSASVGPGLGAGSVTPGFGGSTGLGGGMRFGTAAVSRGTAVRPAVRTTAPADGLDGVLGVTEARRVRKILEDDAARLARAPPRRPLSRGYRESPEPIEPLTAASAARHSERVVRESLVQSNAAARGVDVERVAQQAGSERMGALLQREIEAALRTRVSVDRDFDPERFPNATRRFGSS